jgi:hypothetical protein
VATSIYARLEGHELARARSMELFVNDSRLARKPRCSHTKDYSKIRRVEHALAHPYIQPYSPVAYPRIVFDLDWDEPQSRYHQLPLKYLAASSAWENELGLPSPSWAAISKDRNSAHVAYELTTPVGRHPQARISPQRYLAAIERAFIKALGADPGFNGQLCKNPINSNWDLYQGPIQGRDLTELAEYVDLTSEKHLPFNRAPRGEIGRNVYLFDEVRYWAYDNIDLSRSAGYECWERSVIATAVRINGSGYSHLPNIKQPLLPINDCKAIGRSVARWSWKNHGKKELTRAFSELQSWRGARGAVASAKVKRDRREAQILDAIGTLISRGELPTMVKVAGLIGCSKGNLSTHYKHLFQGTLN